jgi:hypothetical protein
MGNGYKIVLTDYFAPESVSVIEKHVPEGFDFVPVRSKSRDEMMKLITDADFFIASGATGTDAAMIKAAP